MDLQGHGRSSPALAPRGRGFGGRSPGIGCRARRDACRLRFMDSGEGLNYQRDRKNAKRRAPEERLAYQLGGTCPGAARIPPAPRRDRARLRAEAEPCPAPRSLRGHACLVVPGVPRGDLSAASVFHADNSMPTSSMPTSSMPTSGAGTESRSLGAAPTASLRHFVETKCCPLLENIRYCYLTKIGKSLPLGRIG